MIFLLLSILCSTSIYLIFKLSEVYKANLKGIIIINYFVATLTGFASGNFSVSHTQIIQAEWLPIAAIVGFLFVVMFYLIGLSSQKAGMSVTAIATRMSMIFPVFFSMFLFSETITPMKILLVIVTLSAVFMAIYRKPKQQNNTLFFILPFILFVGSGSVDTLVKTAQHIYIPENETALFSSSLFGISLILSPLLLLIGEKDKHLFSLKTLIGGVALGAVNFGSLYFIIEALNKSNIDSSFVYGINNLAIVTITHTAGFFLFKEHLSRLNKTGLILSLICILLLLSY